MPPLPLAPVLHGLCQGSPAHARAPAQWWVWYSIHAPGSSPRALCTGCRDAEAALSRSLRGVVTFDEPSGSTPAEREASLARLAARVLDARAARAQTTLF